MARENGLGLEIMMNAGGMKERVVMEIGAS
jgi:hypothetical protein